MPKNKQKAKANESLAKDIVTKFTHSLTWRTPYKQKWDRFYKLYRSHLDDTAYPWQSNLFIPYTFSTIETILPRMVNTKPQIDIMPREKNDVKYAKLQSKIVDYEWEVMGMDQIMPDVVKEMLIYGTAIMKVYWEKREEEVERPRMLDDLRPELGEKTEAITETTYDAPVVELIDLYDFFWDPRGITIDDCRWVAHRTYRTIGYLNDLQKQGIYKNIKLVEAGNLIKLDDEKDERRGTAGVAIPEELKTDDTENSLVELIEYWEDDRVVTIANREVVIRDEENPYNHGKKPFVRLVDQSIPHEFLGIGEVEPIETLQYELNSRRNQRMDNITLILNRMWVIKNGAGVDEDELVSDAGGVIHTNEMGGIEPITMPDVTASSYNEETLIKADIQQTTGVSDFTKGMGAESLGNDTATGISLIQEAGNARFRQKIRNMENALKRLGKFMVSLNEQFIDEERVIRIVGDEGEEWMEIKPNEVRSNFDVEVEAGSSLPSNEAIERKQIMEAYQLFANDPDVNQVELKRMVAEVIMPKANIDKLLPNPQGVITNNQLPAVTNPEITDQEGLLESALAPVNA